MTTIDRRPAWGARPPQGNPGGFTSLDGTVCHFVGAGRGYVLPESADHSRCQAQVRGIQNHALTIPGMSDIHYNALVCVHGVILEGRIDGTRSGANGTAESNRTEPSVCALLGIDDQPTQRMLDGLAAWHAIIEGRAGRQLTMRRHGQVVSTSCPGVPLGRWVDNGGWRQPVTPPQPPTPDPEDDMNSLIRMRFRGFWNIWLVGGTPTHLTPETNAHYERLGVPEIVSEPTDQALDSLLHISGLTRADLVPSDGS